ncbi:hypothetical protein FB45DRAFT_888331 [Roridomyces roridus]|uniref:TNase-like domain-containing protein n=1 Tax=Roridomyces roridus TaxID=1738132 RepID=A0AAD7FZ12_9AGAR|nr:hypothetical protein FB45DRAFT_888331 [Roridomyces roridus]
MPLIPWPASKDDSPPKEIQALASRLRDIPAPVLTLSAFALGSVSTVSGGLLYRRYLRRIKNSDWVTPDVFAKKRWIKGRVTSVGDSDNFRLYHTPAFGWRWPLKFRVIPSTAKDLKDQTLHIRIAGVDAPEAAHFGRPSQPYSEESLAWLRQKILGKTVYCQLFRRDQYSRIVAYVTLSPNFLPGNWVSGKSLPLEMLRAGCVTTYLQAGAEYGKEGKEEYLRVEAEAKAARRGMWANGLTMESPAEYKRRHAASEGSDPPVKKIPAPQTPSQKSWLSRLFSR